MDDVHLLIQTFQPTSHPCLKLPSIENGRPLKCFQKYELLGKVNWHHLWAWAVICVKECPGEMSRDIKQDKRRSLIRVINRSLMGCHTVTAELDIEQVLVLSLEERIAIEK